MKTSAFTPTGLLKMSGEHPLAQRIYSATRAALGPELAGEMASFADCFAFAFALAVARGATLLERAWGQMLPTEVTDLLGEKEEEYGLIPSPGASITARRQALAARMLVPGGAGRLNIENALQTLLGASFIAYRTTAPAERAMWPTTLGSAPQNLVDPATERKLLHVVPAVSIGLGAPQTVTYAPVLPLAPAGSLNTLAVGDQLVVEPELLGRAEVVTVSAVADHGQGVPTFTAIFNEAHEPGCWATTMPFPAWTSTQRASLVIVDALAALDPEVRRQINELMDRLARCVSTWAIVQATGPTQAGPYRLSVSPLDATPLGAVTTY
jgi:hypothetical protein